MIADDLCRAYSLWVRRDIPRYSSNGPSIARVARHTQCLWNCLPQVSFTGVVVCRGVVSASCLYSAVVVGWRIPATVAATGTTVLYSVSSRVVLL